ncbi:hypothetical protein [Cohnella fermenti]|uniref:Uncharacterized protein n=1 Tax=Cohnella fermenti TaxID=2565925 RepID=A0A4V3WF40_9BACL|nr:hypothetical protein [Cohnella fermenti]THF78801.1 hypothetical protein E6C55_13855 [Cohnella fermenti]
MSRAYVKLAWGLALAMFSLRIGGFDLLPDIVGYALVLAGLAKLKDRQSGYRIAWMASIVLLVYSVLPFLGVSTRYELFEEGRQGGIDLAVVMFGIAGQMLLGYGILDGIRTAALQTEGARDLARTAATLWRWTFALGAATLVLFPFQLNFANSGLYLLLALLTLGLLATNLCLIVFLSRRRRALGALHRQHPY